MVFRFVFASRWRASCSAALVAAGMISGGCAAVADPVSVTLINLPSVDTFPKLVGCAARMPALNDSLKAAGVSSRLIDAPNANGIRTAMMTASLAASRGPQVLVVCGYGAVRHSRLFVMPGGAAVAPEDLSRDAMSAASFSRVVQPNGGVIFDLHPLSVEPPLRPAVEQWQADSSVGGRRLSRVEEDVNGASLIDLLITLSQRGSDAFFPGVFITGAAPEDATPATATPTPSPGLAAPSSKPAVAAAAAGASTAAATPSSSPPAVAAASIAAEPPPASTVPNASAAATTPVAAPVPAVKPVVKAPAVEPPSAAAVPQPANTPPAEAPPAKPAVRDAVTADRTGTEDAPVVDQRAADVAAAPPVAKEDAPKATAGGIRSLQVALLARGFYSGQISGRDNGATHVAIKRFQAVLGHPATGRLTPDEIQQLTGG